MQTPTKNLSLNQWELTDKPTMADFNRDNAILDEAICKKADRNRGISYSAIPISLPLTSGTLEGTLYYTKDSAGTVFLYLTAAPTDLGQVMPGRTTLVTIPEGYRPIIGQRAVFTCATGYTTTLDIGTTGKITTQPYPPSAHWPRAATVMNVAYPTNT